MVQGLYYLRNKKGKTRACAIKLDMVKAYNRVEWNYLYDIMMALGLPTDWCNLVMRYITSVSFSVRVNGVLTPSFKLSPGIPQVDPILPYLFLLCSKGLTSMLKARGSQYFSKGIQVS